MVQKKVYCFANEQIGWPENGGTLFGNDITIDIGSILKECYERNIATDVPGTRVDVEMIDGALFAVARYDGTYPIFRFNETDEVEYPSLEEIADSPEMAVITIKAIRDVASSTLAAALMLDKNIISTKKRHAMRFGEVMQSKELGDGKVKVYIIDDDQDFSVDIQGQQYHQYKVLNNRTLKECTIPASMYPMPNVRVSPSIFHKGNTKDLEDDGELARILDEADVKPQMGKCYSNAEKVYDALQASGYTSHHKVEYFSGWMTLLDTIGWHHHAWIVVDDQSVIDLTHEVAGPLIEMQEKARAGKQIGVKRENLVKEIKRFEAQSHSFRERFSYGCCDSWCYIGVPSDKEEAIISFRDVMAKYPEHPSYDNVDKETYTNGLNRLYYDM